MTRITHKDAERSFESLIRVIGGRVANSYNDVGAYLLDYNETYGGCVVHLVTNKAGGVRCPFGMSRMTPAEFVNAVRFTCDVLHRTATKQEATNEQQS